MLLMFFIHPRVLIHFGLNYFLYMYISLRYVSLIHLFNLHLSAWWRRSIFLGDACLMLIFMNTSHWKVEQSNWNLVQNLSWNIKFWTKFQFAFKYVISLLFSEMLELFISILISVPLKFVLSFNPVFIAQAEIVNFPVCLL